ncbi:23S rRNA (uracil(1939)-C(5))-methyltransferase RlmD [Salirhabdus salicampi]|uniref:23S rRNA (uracil(1939)-C(5))-methyltransferase RlmD n=1 Tax=Salirhabdus salicampi TaxID=476102 RepID=UPI0020C27D06|nr:23S rRNA (uracil(1939)-C(5))-methyltransferase RlmD [Salirhabdus salicampi]MCP8617920.1 23S rRNA (uracil(1939)-C(5))-methyltransferase RlmD [Salirhabdus salicampi]
MNKHKHQKGRQKQKHQQNQQSDKPVELLITIKRMGINGEGIGYYKRKAVFVQGALPGEEVIVVVTREYPKYIRAEMKRIRTKSKDRVDPPCDVYEACGGCQLQHLRYEKQLAFKRDLILQSLERYVKKEVDPSIIKKTIGMKHPWDYRNKSQLQVGRIRDNVIVGLYGQGSHRLIDITGCLVQHPKTNDVALQMKKIIADLNIPVYQEKKHEGIIRTIVTRLGFETGQIQLVLVTTKESFPKKQLLIKEIQKRLPQVTSLMLNVNNERTSLIYGENTFHLSGEEYIEEKLDEIGFELSARAFFQLNPAQTIKLYNEVKKVAELTGEEKVVDAYCGVGTIGLWLASNAKEVRGMEVIEDAVKDARKNAEKRGVDNVKYYTGTAESWLPKWKKEGFDPDVIIVDPPRTGCDNRFLETVKKIRPKKFIYVSCNPSTLAKDLDALMSKYEIKSIQPVDMFPQTSQVESITLLELK